MSPKGIQGLIIVTFFLVGHSMTVVSAQSSQRLDIPRNEHFEPADGLIVPWRSSGCKSANPLMREKNCLIIRHDQFIHADHGTIFDEEGLVWISFSLTSSQPDYFLKIKNPQFEPLTVYPTQIRHTVILRQVGESPNWYKVIVNENKREPQYILKADSFWAKDGWRDWLFEGMNIRVAHSTNLMEEPGGQTLRLGSDLRSDRLRILEYRDEWLKAEGIDGDTQQIVRGWVRWREGARLLVGCIFNNFEIPGPNAG